MKISRGIHALFAIILMAFCFFGLSHKSATAAPVLYDWYANTSNLYSDTSLLYFFENLTASTDYTMQVQELNLDGSILRTLQTIDLPSNSTTTAFLIAPWQWPTGFGPNLDRLYAPLQVMDQFGRTLGRHWITSSCTTDWESFSDLVGFAEVCRNDDALPGFFHDGTNPNASSYDPTYGPLTFLHYRTATSTTDKVFIYRTDDGTLFEAYELSAFLDYQEQNFQCNVSACSVQALGVDGSKNFVVFSTDQSVPAGIAIQARNRAYTTPGNADPNTHEFPTGAFEYPILDSTGTTLVNGGQSLYLQSLRSSATAVEWSISIDKSAVEPSAEQTVRLNTTTPAVGNDLQSQSLVDSVIGDVDTGTYAYQSQRVVIYNVDSVEASGITLDWFIGPTDMQFVLDPTLYDFILTSAPYSIQANIISPFTDRTRTLKTALGLDTIFGSTVLLTFFWILGFLAANFIKRGDAFLQVIMFGAIGTLYTFIFDPPLILKLLFAFGVVFLLVMILRNPRRETA